MDQYISSQLNEWKNKDTFTQNCDNYLPGYWEFGNRSWQYGSADVYVLEKNGSGKQLLVNEQYELKWWRDGENLYFQRYFYQYMDENKEIDQIEKYKFKLEKKYCSYDGYVYLYLILLDDNKKNPNRQYLNEKYFNQNVYCRRLYDLNSNKSYVGKLFSNVKIIKN